MITYKFDIDVTPGGVPIVIPLKQYDDDVFIEFKPYSRYGDFELQSGTNVFIRGTKPDGNGISYDADLDDGSVFVEITKQMTAVDGKSVYELVFEKDDKELITATFYLYVSRAAFDKDTVSNSVIRELISVIDRTDEIIDSANRAEDAEELALMFWEPIYRAITDSSLAREDLLDLIEDLLNSLREQESLITDFGALREGSRLGFTSVQPSDIANMATETWVENSSSLSEVKAKIPNQASAQNQLADKDFVNSSIQNVAAYYITKDAAGNSFATKAELDAATVFYSGGVVRVPTMNDYLVILADESKTISETGENPTTRYLYNNGVWQYQYIVNRSGLTAAQWASVTSGITALKVSDYDSHIANNGVHVSQQDRDEWNAKAPAYAPYFTISSALTLSTQHYGAYIMASGTFTITLPTASSSNAGVEIEIHNIGTGTITIKGALRVGGANYGTTKTIVLDTDDAVTVKCTGTGNGAWKVIGSFEEV